MSSKREALEDKLAEALGYAEIPFVRQFYFAKHLRRKTTGRPYMYRADFLIRRGEDDPTGIIVEVQGGTWTGGRHTLGKGYDEDRFKAALAQRIGYVYIEVTASMIRDGVALTLIESALGRTELWQEAAA